MVQSCIYVPDPLRVICSPEYPDSAGDCYKAIELTKSKLNNDKEFLKVIPVMIGAIMDRGKAKNGDFQLYVTKLVISKQEVYFLCSNSICYSISPWLFTLTL